MEVATFHANRWTDPSQNLHGMLFSNSDGHRGLKAFVGVPKVGAHLLPKTVNWPFKAEGG